MKKMIINGTYPVSGSVRVSGSKNAALPIIFATLATHGISKIEGVPDIGDVRVALRMISSLGARIAQSENTLFIDTRELSYNEPSEELTSSIRASTYLIGSMLSRFSECKISKFGGCNFSLRPIDIHIDAAASLGAELIGDRIYMKKRAPADIRLRLPSVGATVNALILASSIEGESRIFGAAREPHISTLIQFLSGAGAVIEEKGGCLSVKGGHLHGSSVRIPGDMIEAGTYIASALVTNGEISVLGCEAEELSSAVSAFSSLGADITISGGEIKARRGKASRAAHIVATPYPGFPTDLQPIAAAVMACGVGGIISDMVWQSRFGYLDTLFSFGVRYKKMLAGAIIEKTRLSPSAVKAPDLRGGVAALLIALSVNGHSEIENADVILRGYERLEEKFRLLGQDIRIEAS